MFSRADGIDHRNDPGLGADGAERAAVDALSAADALLIVDYRNPIFIIGDRIHRTAELAGSLQVCNSIIGTGLRTFPALLTF